MAFYEEHGVIVLTDSEERVDDSGAETESENPRVDDSGVSTTGMVEDDELSVISSADSVVLVDDSDTETEEPSYRFPGRHTLPIPQHYFFLNSRNLVMLTYGRICAGVDSGMVLALQSAVVRDMWALVHFVLDKCISMSLCCWCCCSFPLGVVCYTQEQLRHRVEASVFEGLGLCDSQFSFNRYLIRRIEFGGFQNPYPHPQCRCPCSH